MNVEEIRKKVRSLCEDAGLQFFFAVPNASEWAVTDCEHLRKIVSCHKKLETLPLVTPTQNWIPVSERLPQKKEQVLCCEKDKVFIGCMVFEYDGVPVFSESNYKHFYVTAWMPLPKPYKTEMDRELMQNTKQ